MLTNGSYCCAGVVELVDALDSKSSGPCARASSTLASGTNFLNKSHFFVFNDSGYSLLIPYFFILYLKTLSLIPRSSAAFV